MMKAAYRTSEDLAETSLLILDRWSACLARVKYGSYKIACSSLCMLSTALSFLLSTELSASISIAIIFSSNQ